VKYRDAQKIKSTKRKLEGNWDAHMKEREHITDSTIDPRKKRKRGMSFSNSK
jgi:hypothetical protein